MTLTFLKASARYDFFAPTMSKSDPRKCNTKQSERLYSVAASLSPFGKDKSERTPKCLTHAVAGAKRPRHLCCLARQAEVARAPRRRRLSASCARSPPRHQPLMSNSLRGRRGTQNNRRRRRRDQKECDESLNKAEEN
jgi:hypothetical protein